MLKQLEYIESILRSDPLKAYEMVDEISKESEAIEDHIHCMILKTKSLILMTRISEGYQHVFDLLELLKEHDLNEWMPTAYNLVGTVYSELANYDQALEYFMKGLHYCKEHDDPRTEAMILNNIGDLYNRLGVLDEAKIYFRSSLEMTSKGQHTALGGIVQLNMAEIYYKERSLDKAEDQVNAAIDVFMTLEDYTGIAHGHYIRGLIFRKKGSDEKAKKEFLHALDVLRRLHEKSVLIRVYSSIIEILKDEQSYEEALIYIADALDACRISSNEKDYGRIVLLAASVYELLGDSQEAIKYYRLHAENRASYEKHIEEQHQRNIQAQINIEKINHEKEIYRLKNVELKKKSDEIQKLYEHLSTINTISQDITATLDIKKILYLLYENINKLMDATMFGIFIYDEENELILTDLFLDHGQGTEAPPISLHDENSIGGYVIRNREPIFTNDYEKDYPKYKKSYNANNFGCHSNSMITVPLVTRESVVGAITVQSCEKDAYQEYHFNMLKTLGSHIAIAIKNSQESAKLSQEIEERIKTQNKLEVLNEKLSHMSYIDALTNIPNRRSFVDYFDRELKRAKRLKEQISLLIIDIDFFKEYNDNYGHVEGDKCLFLVASLLKRALKREVDFVARYGGDEFVAVMSNVDQDGAYAVAKEMVENIKTHKIEHKHSPIADQITITIGGYTLIPDHVKTMEQIIHNADNALYVAKDNGRNGISFYDK